MSQDQGRYQSRRDDDNGSKLPVAAKWEIGQNLHCVQKKVTPEISYNRNVKSEQM